jgi:hypothetical protein
MVSFNSKFIDVSHQEDGNSDAGRRDRPNEPPTVRGGQYDEQKEQEERTDRPFTDEGQRRSPENVEPVKHVSMRDAHTRRTMDIHEDNHAVDGVPREHGIRDRRQASGLRGIEVNCRQRRDGEKCASDGEYPLEPSYGPRVDVLSRDQPGCDSDWSRQYTISVPSPRGSLPIVLPRNHRGIHVIHRDAY